MMISRGKVEPTYSKFEEIRDLVVWNITEWIVICENKMDCFGKKGGC
jgi:hypothetical protein